jgi:hypothetical protein
MMCNFSLLSAYSPSTSLQRVHLLGDVGHEEKGRVLRREFRGALIGEVHRMPLLVQHEVERLLQIAHALLPHRQLAVGDGVELHALHQLLDPRLLHQLEQPLVLGHAELRLVELEGAVLSGLLVGQKPLGLGQEGIHDRGLPAHQLRHLAIELPVPGVVVVPDRAGDDQRRPRLVDEDGVHLVDDGVGVLTLDPLLQRKHHVVAQVVEAELVVGPVGDVRLVRRAPLGRGRLGVVETRDREAEVAEDVAHPLGVAAGQVVVDRDQVGTAAGERVEVERERSHQRLALARRHLGDPPLVQDHGADKLYVVGHHFPGKIVPGNRHGGPQQPTARLTHGGVGLGQQVLQGCGELALPAGFQFAEPRLQALALRRIRTGVLGRPDRLQLGTEGAGPLVDARPEPVGLGAQVFLAELAYLLFVALDLVHDRLQPLPLAVEPGPQDRGHQLLDHRPWSKYSRSAAM